ncbi:hypothetical protein REPUB_Repub07fG0029400 [Reevesia pubescens]
MARRILNKFVANPDDRSHIWLAMWKSAILSKVKFFLWCLFWDILPTRSNLIAKGIVCDHLCVVCGRNTKSIFHVFFDCDFSKVVWLSLCPWLVQFLATFSELASFWVQLLTKANEVGHLRVLLYSLWFLWTNRNNCLYKDSCFTPSAFCHLVNNLLVFSTDAELEDMTSRPSLVSSWYPPDKNAVKVNVDATFNELEQQINMFRHEMRAILFEIKLAMHEGYDTFRVESDAHLAISEIQNANTSLWKRGSLTLEILKYCRICTICIVGHIERQANFLGHNIARISYSPGFQRIWYHELPNDICNSDFVFQ